MTAQPQTDVEAAATTLRIGDDALREHCLESTVAWRGKLLDVRRDVVRLPDGKQATREYIVHPGAVMVIPIVDDQHVIVERQYRYPMARVMLEFPAGKIDEGEAPWLCAQRELREETGYRATAWARAGILHNAIAYSTEGIEIWFARGLVAGTMQLDAGEFLEVLTVADAELDAGVRDGVVTDAKTMVGLMYLQKLRAGTWPMTWLDAGAAGVA